MTYDQWKLQIPPYCDEPEDNVDERSAEDAYYDEADRRYHEAVDDGILDSHKPRRER